MGQKTYYHNLTKGWFNENSYSDAAENSEIGDILKMTFRGNALVFDLLDYYPEIEDDHEHDWAREQFLTAFREIHNTSFIFGDIKS
ncbi:hypothetical protein ACMGDK_11595 [Chryseobacterium sp. DT-3]|uniref:hypothetical protein n=1 Tax=Chryseobacterium sp. DT-3 TaxID=3396164 RepID=UPI003F1A5DFC